MRKCLFSLFLFFAIPAFAKYQVIDSLQQLVSDTNAEVVQMELYQQLCESYRKVDADTSLYYGKLAYEMAKKNEVFRVQSATLLAMGMVHWDKANMAQAGELLNEAFEISHFLQDTSLMSSVANGLGLNNWRLGRNDLAIKYFQDAHNWALAGGNEKTYLYALNNLGLLSNQNGRSQDAIRYFKKVAQIAKEKNNQEGQVLAILNIAVSHKALAMYDSALLDFKKAIPMLKSSESMARLAKVYYNITDVQNHQKKYKEAIAASNDGLKICQEFGFKDTEILCLLGKSKAFLESNNNSFAIKTAKEGISKVRKVGKLAMNTNFFQVLAQAYEKEKWYKEALFWQKNYAGLKDSLYNMEREKEIAQLEIGFNTQQKEAENSRLKQEKESQSMLLNQRTRMAILSTIALFIILFIAILLFRARQEVRIMNTDLEKKVAVRTEELNQSNKQLLISNEELKRFAFIASHDLKEPLRNMGGFISLMKRRIRKKDYESLDEYMEFVEKGNHQMVDLVENVLEFSKLDSNEQAKKDKVNLQEVLSNVSNLFSNAEKKVEIVYSNLPAIFASPSLLKIVIKNLIENAIKYNKSEVPQINIKHKVVGDQFELHIKDNGIGIDPEYHEKIFDMFVRLHNRGEYKGSGMGLAFVKKILNNNEGDIRVESEEGKGSTFIVSLTANVLPEEIRSDANQREGTRIHTEDNSPRRATQ